MKYPFNTLLLNIFFSAKLLNENTKPEKVNKLTGSPLGPGEPVNPKCPC